MTKVYKHLHQLYEEKGVTGAITSHLVQILRPHVSYMTALLTMPALNQTLQNQ